MSEPSEPKDSAAPPAEALELQRLAVRRATELGHLVGAWDVTAEAGASGWRATCSRCGAVAYIRREHGMLGIAGAITLDPCPRAIPAGD